MCWKVSHAWCFHSSYCDYKPAIPVFPAAEPGLVVGDEQAKCFSALPTKTQNNRTARL